VQDVALLDRQEPQILLGQHRKVQDADVEQHGADVADRAVATLRLASLSQWLHTSLKART
jgi:hypothetical protein